MTRGSSRRSGASAAGEIPSARKSGCTVTVCRGCCCGTAHMVPGLDHAEQLRGLREAVADAGVVRASDCLSVCERANVMVVQPSAAGRQAGGRPMWLGLVNDVDASEDIAAWLRAGGPGLAEPPDTLSLYAFTPSRRVRQAHDH